MKQTYYSQSLCQVHREPYTNICTDINCLQLLCPECIDLHIKEHKNCQIDSLKSCRSNCAKKIKHAIHELNLLLNQEEVVAYKNQSLYIESIETKLKQFQQQAVSMMDAYCKQLIKTASQQLQQTYKDTQLGELNQRITSLIKQLDQLSNRLDAGQVENNRDLQLETMKSVCLLNTQQLISNSQGEIRKEINKLRFPVLILDPQFSGFLHDTLQQQVVIEVRKRAPSHTESVIEPEYRKDSQFSLPSKEDTKKAKKLAWPNLEVTMQNYFTVSEKYQQLHSFQFNSKEVFLFNLRASGGAEKPKIEKLSLNINFKIPIYHQSVVSSYGVIYLLGGAIPDPLFPKNKSGAIYQFDRNKLTLFQIGEMVKARSSHGSVIIGDYIYSVSGLIANSVQDTSFERFNINLKKSELLQDCKFTAIASCCVNFNNEFIYKFGGMLGKQRLNCIERYSLRDRVWQIIDPDIPESLTSQFKGFYQFSSGVQINEATLLIFGGYDEHETPVDQQISFTVVEDMHLISGVNQKPLKMRGGFWFQQALVHDESVWALQNVEDEKGTIIEGQKRLLRFKKNWFS